MVKGTINFKENLRKAMATEMGFELRKWLKFKQAEEIAKLENQVKKKFLEMPENANYKDQIEGTIFKYHAEAFAPLDKKK
jgi:hypothetical protein